MGNNSFKRMMMEINQWISLKDKIIVSALLVVLVIVAVLMYKSMLLGSVIGKAKKYEAQSNAYQEINNDVSESVKTYKIYKKGDKIKTITITRKNTKVTTYSTASSETTYIDSNNDKVMSTSDTKSINNITVNYIGASSTWDILGDALVASIKTEKVDGIVCYVIAGTESKETLASQGIKEVKLYIEKDTGLPVKKVCIMTTGEEKVTTYEYQFGVVTDQDMKQPGVTQYRMQTN